ncbi:unnamed protein product [Thelazia callipaeda]|uniref:Carboxypeptidase n=1 Tax=Thelazia callipaeda TaxID=103827 RepID=A0A0N5CSZ0_THECL|nr:unnamed protein product [Thelazia callipaeda]
MESQTDPENKPLILWFNGGPGCSSILGLLSELGPFRPNPDGETLYEYVFSWNKMANVLFIDSPRKVGFSYQDEMANNDDQWNDEKTATDALNALLDFFTIFPELTSKEFYIAGESYGGVYVPLLTSYLLQYMQEHSYALNFKGIMVGNGYVSQKLNIRSLADFLYFHGLFGRQEWRELSSKCCQNATDGLPQFQCEYDRFVEFGDDGDVRPKNVTDDNGCGDLVVKLSWHWIEHTMYATL